MDVDAEAHIPNWNPRKHFTFSGLVACFAASCMEYFRSLFSLPDKLFCMLAFDSLQDQNGERQANGDRHSRSEHSAQVGNQLGGNADQLVVGPRGNEQEIGDRADKDSAGGEWNAGAGNGRQQVAMSADQQSADEDHQGGRDKSGQLRFRTPSQQDIAREPSDEAAAKAGKHHVYGHREYYRQGGGKNAGPDTA